MQVLYKQADSLEELGQILALQQANLSAKLSPLEKAEEGFVTVEHNLDILHRMNQACGHIIAKSANIVVGYALCMHPSFSEDIAILRPMFTQLSKVLPTGYRYMAMGQVCVSKAFRGKGIFRGLYLHMSQTLKPGYDGIATEVDTCNQRSLNAHKAVGFKEIGTYASGGQDWHLLLLEFRKSK
jgi:predicted GNAT family N-acyltransferase